MLINVFGFKMILLKILLNELYMYFLKRMVIINNIEIKLEILRLFIGSRE